MPDDFHAHSEPADVKNSEEKAGAESRRPVGESPLDAARRGRLLRKAALRDGEDPPGEVLILGEFSTGMLADLLTAELVQSGLRLTAIEGRFDNVVQEVGTGVSIESAAAVVLLPDPWLLAGLEESSIDAFVSHWVQVWDLIRSRSNARIVQVGYDAPGVGAAGFSQSGRTGALSIVRKVNDGLCGRMAPDTWFVDVEAVAAAFGQSRFHDPRDHYWTRTPYSIDGLHLLARHIATGLRVSLIGPKKVLVLDLDNTLWGGIVGEVGAHGVAIGEGAAGEAFRDFQRYVKALQARGLILAVASKNNPEDARSPFHANRNMVLSLDDFAAFEASWDPKPAMLERISAQLRLSLDSFVFFDDSPFERDHVRTALPAVSVVDVPEDPASYVRACEESLWFEMAPALSSDRDRPAQYRLEMERASEAARFLTTEEFLESLRMKAEVRLLDETDLDRATQLVARTNQFNLTTRRHSRSTLARLAADPDSLAITIRVGDRFGDHGMVAVMIGTVRETDAEAAMEIDTWLMSCRVLGRSVEAFTLAAFAKRARDKGHTRLRGVFVSTPKNALVADLYTRMGFKPESGGSAVGESRFLLELADFEPPPCFVTESES